MVYLKHQIQIQMKIWSRNLSTYRNWLTNFQVEITKKHVDLQACQQLCSRANIYLVEMRAYASKLFLLKCNEKVVFFFKFTQNKL